MNRKNYNNESEVWQSEKIRPRDSHKFIRPEFVTHEKIDGYNFTVLSLRSFIHVYSISLETKNTR